MSSNSGDDPRFGAVRFIPAVRNLSGIGCTLVNIVYLVWVRALQKDYMRNVTLFYLLLIALAYLLHQIAAKKAKLAGLIEELAGAIFVIALFFLSLLSLMVFIDAV